MHVAMLQAMLLMTFACWMYAIAATLTGCASIILERERRTRWVRAPMTHEFYLWMSYGVFAVVIAVEIAGLALRRRSALRRRRGGA